MRALGAMAWHRLTGIHPFGDDRTSQLLAIVAGRMPRPGGTTVARGLRNAMSAAQDPDPAGRPTALELAVVFGGTG